MGVTDSSSAGAASLATVASTDLPGHRVILGTGVPLRLESGLELHDFPVAYQTYGALNEDRSNAILVCHALTGDQYLAGPHPITGKPGWWDHVVGPGKVIDTGRYFVICANILGGCMGTIGPKEINPETGKPWGLSFPVITIGDMVEAQKLLIDHLGVDKLFAVIGGSMGGMQVLEWAARYPERIHCAVPIATALHHTAQNIAFHEVGRQAIMADPDWQGGDYYDSGRRPTRGLAVARMAAHITYLSEAALHRKFGRRLQKREDVTYGFDADFQVESYLRHQGITFVDRFDANSYLYITRAMDYFDMAKTHGGVAADAFRASPVRFCVISFSGDWLYPTSENQKIVHALNAVAANVSFAEIVSDKGHDAFLLDEPEFHRVFSGFLQGAEEKRRRDRRDGNGETTAHVRETELSPAETRALDRRSIRVDLQLIADMIEPGSRVLDVGCGDGKLLEFLVHERGVDGRGIELSVAGVNACISAGLPVIQGDAETVLADYPDHAFDYVVLSQTLQATHQPREVLHQLLRIGERAIVSFPNFAHWRLRLYLGLRGRMPMSSSLPCAWYDTPNIHFCTIRDFEALCAEMDITVERSRALDHNGKPRHIGGALASANLFGEQAVFLLRK